MPLCTACSEIDLKPLVAAAYNRYTTTTDKLPPEGEELSPSIPYYKHIKNCSEIRDNVALCDCCTVLGTLIPKKVPGTEPGTSGEFLLYVLLSKPLDDFEKPSLVICAGNHEGLWQGAFDLYKRISGKGKRSWYRTFEDANDIKDDPIEALLGRILPTNSGSPECLSQAKKWLMDCEAKHPDCRRANGNLYPLPSRVLRVGDDHTDPSLYETKGESGRWVALSYCWGLGPKLVLNRESEPELLRGKPLSSFPATIRDAILVARGLDIKYIWVDALCINQGYKSDWDREAPKMAQIYSHAVLTIINGHGNSSSSGIFRDRSELGNAMLRGPTCSLPWRRSPRSEGIDTGSAPETESIVLNKVQKNPTFYAGPASDRHTWATRCWTLQEELLSWRTLTFMKSEALWSCPSAQVWESGYSRIATADYSRDYDSGQTRRVNPNLGLIKVSKLGQQCTNYSSGQAGLPTLTTPAIYRSWYLMVEEYSKRSLTNDKDKLMAVSGMARNVQGYISDRYCAGLWENDLIGGLVWDYDEESWSHGYTPFEVNSDPGLPSWSWASINGEVHFPYKEQALEAKTGATAKFVEVAKVEKLQIKHVFMDPFGPILGCELVITGPSYCCSAKGEFGMCDTPELQRILQRELIKNSEFKGRHKYHPNQKTVFMQLAWIEAFTMKYFPTREKIPFPACALLVLETMDRPELETPSDNTEETYRRVSLLHFGGVEKDMTMFQQAAWSMTKITAI